MVKFKDFSRPLSVFQVLFKANLIFKDFLRESCIFQYFSSLCEPWYINELYYKDCHPGKEFNGSFINFQSERFFWPSMTADIDFWFGLILYVPSTIFQLYRDGSSWVEPVLTKDKCVLLKDHNTVTPVRLEPAALWSRVEHYTTEPLRSLQI